MKVGKIVFGKKKSISLGIDIQKNVIRYCTMRHGNWIYGEKLANGSFFTENGVKNQAELNEILHEIFVENHLRNPMIILSILNSKLLIRQIPLNKMQTEKEIREFLYFELGESIPLPFEKPIFDLLVLDPANQKKKKTAKKRGEEKTRIIKENRLAVNGQVPVIITSEPILEELGECIHKSGGQLIGVDCSALTYSRLLKRNINWGQNFVLVELDSGAATITIFEELVPVYVQYEDYNQANWKYRKQTDDIIAEFRMSSELEALEVLGNTLQNLITYFETEISATSKIAQIYLVGGHPLLKNEVHKRIQQENKIPVKTLSSTVKLKNQKRLPDRFLLAAGLSMKEVR